MTGRALVRTLAPVHELDPHLVDLDRRPRASAFGRGGYEGARSDRRETREWGPGLGSVDSDTLPDLATLRARSRDAIRNHPLAAGAVRTYAASVIGTGLVPRPQIDRDVLGLSEEEAKQVETAMLRYWYAWADTRACDLTRRQNYAGLTRVVFRDLIGDGDTIGIRRYRPGPDSPLGLRVQVIDADRLSNPQDQPDTDRRRAGIEYGEDGEPVRYWFRDRHPGDRFRIPAGADTWTAVEARGPRSGELQVLHIFDPERANQARGVPALAPVLIPLKQLTRYSESELMAAVISAAFTVFLKTEFGVDGGPMLSLPTDNDDTHFGPPPQPEIKLGNGTIVGLNPGESIEQANPMRPNAQFDPFFVSMVRQIGAAIGMPFEVVLKHFTASYSASRAAFLELWREVRTKRSVIVTQWCQPSYEWLLDECVARGVLDLRGWTDPLLRRAWSFCEWSGPTQGQIDPESEVAAAIARIRGNLSTHQRETAELTGEDWEAVLAQRAKEQRMIKEAGLDIEPVAERIRTEPQERETAEEEGEDEDSPRGRRQKARATARQEATV